jgi:hypothetical protein
MKEAKLIIVIDDLDFEIKYVVFETKVINRYGTFDQIANRNM